MEKRGCKGEKKVGSTRGWRKKRSFVALLSCVFPQRPSPHFRWNVKVRLVAGGLARDVVDEQGGPWPTGYFFFSGPDSSAPRFQPVVRIEQNRSAPSHTCYWHGSTLTRFTRPSRQPGIPIPPWLLFITPIVNLFTFPPSILYLLPLIIAQIYLKLNFQDSVTAPL